MNKNDLYCGILADMFNNCELGNNIMETVIKNVYFPSVPDAIEYAFEKLRKASDRKDEREELIAMLKELRANIKPMSLCSPMETAIQNVYGSSVDFVLKKTINYLEEEKEYERQNKNT